MCLSITDFTVIPDQDGKQVHSKRAFNAKTNKKRCENVTVG